MENSWKISALSYWTNLQEYVSFDILEIDAQSNIEKH